MSKAFTRESDDAPDQPVFRPASPLPPGVKNYLTAGGAAQLREEMSLRLNTERPQIASLPKSHERDQKLQTLDRRIQQIQQILHSAAVVNPPVPSWEKVLFGATVTVREKDGTESKYRIVGVDETD